MRICDTPDMVSWTRTRRASRNPVAQKERPNTSKPSGRPSKRWKDIGVITRHTVKIIRRMMKNERLLKEVSVQNIK